MQTDIFINSIYSLLMIAELVIMLIVIVNYGKRAQKIAFAFMSLASIVVTGLHIIAPDWVIANQISRDYVIWLGLIATAIIFGSLVLDDVATTKNSMQTRRIWAIISAIWAIGFIIVGAISDPLFAGWASWFEDIPLISASVGAGGFIIYSIYLMGITGYLFYTASMPEVANRAAFWFMTTALLLISIIVIATGSLIFSVIGLIGLYLGMIVTAYGVRNYRVGDVRETVLSIARTLSVITLSWALIFATLYFLTSSQLASDLLTGDANQDTLLIALFALIIAGLLVPARHVIRLIFGQVMPQKRPNLAKATAQYSQLVARAATVEDVVIATTQTINRVIGVRRSALILINNTVRVKDSVELIVLEDGSSLTSPTAVGYLHEKSPIYYTLAEQSTPLGQYDIDYAPIFANTAPQERQFFSDMKLSVFVPISADNRLIGLLASGAKINDTPYSRADIETISVIGQQVGTALRSARLIDDLQHLNDSMRVLNKRLEGAKVELEKLDNIKTDFITIASHELRTPLAQIRGYTDILDSLNQANALKEGQADQLVGNLRKSTERMEELISAMLDVSQIDVNSMDLRFIRTSPETIIKMALEPLRDPAEERNIEVIRHSAKDLPNIEADLQRMVQAVRNIVLNAIKFTPDGGKIEISAVLDPAKHETGVDSILFKIADTGVGIDKKDIEFVFNKFYRAFDTQLHSTGIYKFMGAGPGLGLTIAKGIIEGHGGHIWAESDGHDMNNPRGTVFYVRLPVQPPSGTRRVLPFEADMNRTQLPMGRMQ
ncbi:MAG: ATP-binding protein [Phototrophicaceae bacterium]